jgi:uncharacterized membrane protein YedE/YeeE
MRYLPPWQSAILLAFINFFIFALLGKPWSITTGETHFVAYLENVFYPEHVEANLYFKRYPPLLDWRVFLDFGIVLGAFLGAVLGRDFKIRIARKKTRYLQVFIGGLLMGIGARLALGCNIGHIISGVPQLALSSFLAFISIFVGSYIGTKIILRVI